MEKKILNYIKSYINKNHYPPTIRELCDFTGLTSTSTIHRYLKRLQKEKKLENSLNKNVPRGWILSGVSHPLNVWKNIRCWRIKCQKI
jgi:repressor LexA